MAQNVQLLGHRPKPLVLQRHSFLHAARNRCSGLPTLKIDMKKNAPHLSAASATARTAPSSGAATMLLDLRDFMSDVDANETVDIVESPIAGVTPKARFGSLGRAVIHSALVLKEIQQLVEGVKARWSVEFVDGVLDHQCACLFVEADEAAASRKPDADGWYTNPRVVPLEPVAIVGVRPCRPGSPIRFTVQWAGESNSPDSQCTFGTLAEALEYALDI